ncbi:MAG: cation-translocating P-type ATPase [Myxococcaceae bacterium]
MHRGLTSAQVVERRNASGPNELRAEERTSAAALLLEQFKSPLIWLLLGACVVSGVVGAPLDAIAIGAIVVLNAALGFFQEFRAERALEALRSLAAPRARVIRDGAPQMIAAREVVPGDLLTLEAGDLIAADAALVEAHRFAVNEATLTGESVPVEKSPSPDRRGPTDASRPRGEVSEPTRDPTRIFSGTAVVTGTALATVTAIGMATELGHVAHLLSTADSGATPLEKRLAGVSRMLLWLCLAVVAVVALCGLLQGQAPLTVLLGAVSLAVAAVPEGLPAMVTIALSVGVRRMAARHALVRRLKAVETLGCATVICTDKTGTLTTGQMRVREIWGDEKAVLGAAARCCDAELTEDEQGSGDPTELAILIAAKPKGIERPALERDEPRTETQPFDAQTRMMLVRRGHTAYLKGAVEKLLPLCQPAPGATEAAEAFAARGLRVLAMATGANEPYAFTGLLGIADPPRPAAAAALKAAREAGIVTVMITGDHPKTAQAIAKEIGLLQPGDDPAERVHARATPEDKLRIVREWKAKGAVVAMTGDGVNDAPALRESQIGVAMGRSGAEVTREAADIVLTDDDYATLLAAVKEGRGAFDNIRKALVYLLGGNLGELVVMLSAAVAGLPLPLLPLQLLWVNLLTDGLPALALVVEPAEPDAMKRPPRPVDEPMLGAPQWRQIAFTSLLGAGVTLGVFLWALKSRDLNEARDLAFSTLVFDEVFRSLAARSNRIILWQLGVFTNSRLLAAVAFTAVLQCVLHWVPLAQELLGLQPLAPEDFAICIGVSLIPVTVLEITKLLKRWNG